MTDLDARAARVAGELSKAQREAVCHDFRHKNWTTILALERARIVQIRQCFPDGEGLRLTPLGLAVRKHLETPNDR